MADSTSMVKVIAHRGASTVAHENTLEAFRLAAELGADWVELDVRRTADGLLVLNHDAHLEDGRLIRDTARRDLPSHVCELAEALDVCSTMSVNIEIKNHPDDADFDPDQTLTREIVELVGRRGEQAKTLASCFHKPTIDLVHRLDPTIATAMLGYLPTDIGLEADDWGGWTASVAADGHRAMHPWYPLVDASVVGAIHDAGMEVNVWTVNDPDHMADLVEAGVDGLCTDVPDVARAVLERLGL